MTHALPVFGQMLLGIVFAASGLDALGEPDVVLDYVRTVAASYRISTRRAAP